MIFFPPVTPELEAGVMEKGSKVEWPRRGDAIKTLPAFALFEGSEITAAGRLWNTLNPSNLPRALAVPKICRAADFSRRRPQIVALSRRDQPP
jgi:hypothetical protein